MKIAKGTITQIQKRSEMNQVREREASYRENLRLKKQINEIHKMLKENIK
jgi:hypothetical protein